MSATGSTRPCSKAPTKTSTARPPTNRSRRSRQRFSGCVAAAGDRRQESESECPAPRGGPDLRAGCSTYDNNTLSNQHLGLFNPLGDRVPSFDPPHQILAPQLHFHG